VRSLLGTFAWVTSPYVLARFKRDADQAGAAGVPAVPSNLDVERCLVTNQSVLTERNNNQGTVYLEDLDVSGAADQHCDAWAAWIDDKLFGTGEWTESLKSRFCIVHDDMLSFLLTTSTEVVARIRLQDDTKTVAKGGLWYEESLPTETVLYSLLLSAQSRRDDSPMDAETVAKTLTDRVGGKTLQFGGKATIGRGLCRMRVA